MRCGSEVFASSVVVDNEAAVMVVVVAVVENTTSEVMAVGESAERLRATMVGGVNAATRAP